MTNEPTTGDRAPDLDLPTLDDDRFLLRAHRGRPVIVSFLRHAG